MPTIVTMPQLGETVVEGTILKWLKGEGDAIDRDEPLFEISTDKVDTEVPSPVAGTVSKILVQEGETVSVGTELAQIDDGSAGVKKAEVSSEAAQEPAEEKEAPKAEEEKEEPEQAEEEAESEEKEEPRPAEERPVGREEPQRQPAMAAAEARPARGGGPRSHILSPLVRRLAEENQIDLSQVEGTGTGGRITKQDVLAFVESGGGGEAGPAPPARTLQPVPEPAAEREAVPAPAAARTGDREEAVPMTHIRKAIAKHMVASIQASARAWNLVEVNMENIARLRDRAKDEFKGREGISLTFMPFLARALCDALLSFPDVNGELRDDPII